VGRAAELIGETILGRVLRGYRGEVEATSIEDLARTLHRFSLMAADSQGLFRGGISIQHSWR
jgi:hypothetical protein